MSLSSFLKIAVLSSAFAALVSCVKEQETSIPLETEGTPVELLVSSEITADDDTKTSYTPGAGIKLEGSEKMALYYKKTGSEALTVAKSVLASPTTSPGRYTFTVPSGAEKATWFAVMPYSSSLVGTNSTGTSITLRLGPVQFPKANSFDPQADVLLAQGFDLDVTSGARTAEIKNFKRMFAPLRIRVKGLNEGEKIYAFTVQSSQTPAKYSALNGLTYNFFGTDFESAKFGNFDTNSEGNAMSAVYKDGLAALDGSWPVWLMVNPTTLKSGSTLTFTVSTESRTCTRTVTLTKNIDLKVWSNAINDMSVNIAGAGSDTKESATYVFLDGNTHGWTMANNKSYTEANSVLPAGALYFANAAGSFTFPSITDRDIVGARIYTHPSSRSHTGKEVSLTIDGTDRYNFNLACTTASDGLAYKGGALEILPPEGKSSLAGLQAKVGSENNHIISAITLYLEDPEDKPVDHTLFKMLNWDYAPLAPVKALYDQCKYKKAADALLDYFKTRTNVVNPEVVVPTASDIKYYDKQANDALKENGYRFCVKAGYYYESYSGGVYTYYSFADGEGGINWEFQAPNVGTEWYQKHWHAWFLYLAKTFAYTKDEKYFNAWKEQYSDWMKNYPSPSTGKKYTDKTYTDYGYKSWCELSMATRIENQAELFEYFKTAKGFDFDWLTKFLVAFDDCVQYSMSHLYYTAKSNIRFAQYKSHCLAGIFFPELSNASNWLATGASQVCNAFNISFLDDGCLEELDFGYHAGEIENYRLVYNAAKANGCLDKFSSDYLDNLKKACNFAADYIYPFYQNEVFNDTKESTKNVIKRWMSQYSDMFPSDNKFLYLGSDRTKGTKPTETLNLYKTSGYYFFHSDWASNGMMLIYKNNYNPSNMWHSHLDNGTVAICNKGRMFLPAPGSYTYGGNTELDALRAYHKAARNHNTITMGLADIPTTNSKGKYLTSYTQNGIDCVVAENTSYTGLTHRRAVWMVNKSFFVIADACYGTASSETLNLNWHLLRDATLGSECVAYDDNKTNYSYGAHTVFTDGNNIVLKSFADTSSGFAVETGTSYTSPRLGERYERKYYRINVTKQSSASTPRFITVICPCGSASEVNVSASFPNAYSSAGETVEVTMNGKKYTLSYTL